MQIATDRLFKAGEVTSLQRISTEAEARQVANQLAQAVEQRFDNLAGTSGLNEEVFDALILIAAGTLTPEALARGAARVQQLMRDMADGRFSKLLRLGFERGHAERLASLHTRNFM